MKYVVLLFSLASFCRVANAQVTLYENHFELPNTPPKANCAPDFDQTLINTLWGGTGKGTGGGGIFQQAWTVETILIHGPANQYKDPSSAGGNYSIAMLSTVQDDKLALTLNAQGYPFVNVKFDMSAIGTNGCGFMPPLSTPTMNIKLYDSPAGTFSFNSPGTLLAQQELKGTVPASDIYTFNWASVGAALKNTASGFITIVFDLTSGNYASIDNIKITADNSALPLKLKSFGAEYFGSTIKLNWQTAYELNTSNFIIERAENQNSFVPIASVGAAGDSQEEKRYSYTDRSPANGSNFYRLKMVGNDGKYTFSKVVWVDDTYNAKTEIFPNPATSTATIRLIARLTETVKLKIVSSDGKVVSIRTVNLTAGINHIQINTEQMVDGLYAVVLAGQKATKVFTFLKK